MLVVIKKTEYSLVDIPEDMEVSDADEYIRKLVTKDKIEYKHPDDETTEEYIGWGLETIDYRLNKKGELIDVHNRKI